MVDLAGGSKEPFAPDLPLIGPRWQVAMGLSARGPLNPDGGNSIFHLRLLLHNIMPLTSVRDIYQSVTLPRTLTTAQFQQTIQVQWQC